MARRNAGPFAEKEPDIQRDDAKASHPDVPATGSEGIDRDKCIHPICGQRMQLALNVSSNCWQ